MSLDNNETDCLRAEWWWWWMVMLFPSSIIVLYWVSWFHLTFSRNPPVIIQICICIGDFVATPRSSVSSSLLSMYTVQVLSKVKTNSVISSTEELQWIYPLLISRIDTVSRHYNVDMHQIIYILASSRLLSDEIINVFVPVVMSKYRMNL